MNIRKNKHGFIAFGLLSLLITACQKTNPVITTGSLLDEMVDLNRLTRLPEQEYRTDQFSSYDRRSTKPTDSNWFANEDGFGNEPVPGFKKVIKQPNEEGIGEYLICDIQNPGAIVRLWTAGINGKVRLFLDDMNTPVFEGNAEDFFWNTLASLSPEETETEPSVTLRQFDAVYFPIPFARGCRIEWTGDIRELHFYHVGVRIYDTGTQVETFKANDIITNAGKLEEIQSTLNSAKSESASEGKCTHITEILVSASSKKELFKFEGTQAIEYFSLKIKADSIEAALRSSVLRIYFDHSSVPQIEAPVGDFFGSAPGLNPFQSFPFAVEDDSTMVCRFIMPFKKIARIEVENTFVEEIKLSGVIRTKPYQWEEGESMHFRTRWRINHSIKALNINEPGSDISDILYMKARGQGRLVGAAAYIYNPSDVPTSWGNWWGEGDEKIYMDQDTFPSFFGTGSEDYFNYSWSASRIFFYPYCGQPRNDGPGNRGYVSNFRWHILDDLLFKEKLVFYMELGHHGIVPNFSYGRIVYFYALPDLIDGYQKISIGDIRQITYSTWSPIGYKGSAGFRFIQAEQLIVENSNIKTEKGNLWAEGNILMWTPARIGEKIRFQINAERASNKAKIGLTLAHGPEGGTFSVQVNGNPLKFEGKDKINLKEPKRWILDNHISETVQLRMGSNEFTLESIEPGNMKKIGIDFVWIKE